MAATGVADPPDRVRAPYQAPATSPLLLMFWRLADGTPVAPFRARMPTAHQGRPDHRWRLLPPFPWTLLGLVAGCVVAFGGYAEGGSTLLGASLIALFAMLADASLHRSMADAAARHQTERTHMDHDLKRAEERYRSIVERSVQGFYRGSADGRFLVANAALAQMLGYERPEQLTALPAGALDHLYVDTERRQVFLRQIRETGFVSGFEARLRRRDGRIIWISESVRAVPAADGEPDYCEGFVEDVTARKDTEQMKSDFVSFVTHQLRTPLSGIRWMLELAAQGPLDDETSSFVADARQSAERLIALVNYLLEITRLETGGTPMAAEAIDLSQITHCVVTDLQATAHEKGQRLSLNGGMAAPILMDPQLARQAVHNLVANAITFTPPGGHIAIHASADAGLVRWTISDTGIGIPESAKRRLFEKFFRAENAHVVHTEGTGLGLYLVRLIAERSGGSIAFDSVEGEGSTFTLTLPLAGDKQVAA